MRTRQPASRVLSRFGRIFSLLALAPIIVAVPGLVRLWHGDNVWGEAYRAASPLHRFGFDHPVLISVAAITTAALAWWSTVALSRRRRAGIVGWLLTLAIALTWIGGIILTGLGLARKGLAPKDLEPLLDLRIVAGALVGAAGLVGGLLMVRLASRLVGELRLARSSTPRQSDAGD